VTVENKPAQPQEPTLTETLIKLLADNGHHFAQLGEKENITIVITFREPKVASPFGPIPISLEYGFPTNINSIQSGSLLFGVGVNSDQGLTGSFAPGSGAQGPTQSINQQEKPNTGSGATDAGSGNGKGSHVAQTPASGGETGLGGKPSTSTAKDLILLADLHFKQNKFAEAEALYHKALETVISDKDSAQKTEILRKLAQILVANGKYDEAKHLLEQILAKNSQEAKPVQKEAPKPLPLPAKLIITAPKELLYQVGTKRIDFEAFSKAVTVEYENAETSGK
jgi:hypothetical protein